MFISVIIPAYNEEKLLVNSVNKCHSYLNNNFTNFEIIIVNDGSVDNTLILAKKLKKKYRNIKILDYKKNRGKGFALRQGLLSANGDYCLFLDADFSTSIEHLDVAKQFLQKGEDLIIGSRHEKDNPDSCLLESQPIWKRLLGRSGNLFIRALLIPDVWDTQCGFKILSHRFVKDIVPLTKTNRFAFDVELLALARHKKITPVIIPVKWINCADSRVKKFDYFKTLAEVVKIKFLLWSGRYKK